MAKNSLLRSDSAVPANKNFLLASAAWKKKQASRLPLYAAVLECADERYFLKKPIEEVITTLADRGFPGLTKDAIHHMVQQYRLAMRYFAMKDAEEHEQLEGRLKKNDSRLLGVRCLLRDGITWERICAQESAPKQEEKKDRALLEITAEDRAFIRQIGELFLGRFRAVEEHMVRLEDVFHRQGIHIVDLQERLVARESEIKDLKAQNDVFYQEIQRLSKESAALTAFKETISVKKLRDLVFELSPELYRQVAGPIEKWEEHMHSRKEIPTDLPRKKQFRSGEEISIVYDDQFLAAYDAFSDPVKCNTKEQLWKIAHPNNETAQFQQSLRTAIVNPFRASSGKITQHFIGRKKSRIDDSYRLIWDIVEEGSARHLVVLYAGHHNEFS